MLLNTQYTHTIAHERESRRDGRCDRRTSGKSGQGDEGWFTGSHTGVRGLTHMSHMPPSADGAIHNLDVSRKTTLGERSEPDLKVALVVHSLLESIQ